VAYELRLTSYGVLHYYGVPCYLGEVDVLYRGSATVTNIVLYSVLVQQYLFPCANYCGITVTTIAVYPCCVLLFCSLVPVLFPILPATRTGNCRILRDIGVTAFAPAPPPTPPPTFATLMLPSGDACLLFVIYFPSTAFVAILLLPSSSMSMENRR